MERQKMNHKVQNGLVPWYGYGLWPDEKFADNSPATDNQTPKPEDDEDDDDSGDDWMEEKARQKRKQRHRHAMNLTEACRRILKRFGRVYTARQLRRFIVDGVDGRYLDAFRLPATAKHRTVQFRVTLEDIEAFFRFVPERPENTPLPDPADAIASVSSVKLTKQQKRDIDEARRLCGIKK